jgi:hypothetical protein
MRRILLPGLFCLVANLTSAIDINPSKETVPRNSWDTGGNRFTIFNGDPKRIQRANAVDPKSFDTKLVVSPNPLSLRAVEAVGPNPSVKITFAVHNHSKKTYTLSFPTAQRWDFRIEDASGNVIYTYTDDHDFVQTIGTSMVNEDDSLTYSESVDFSDMTTPLAPGTYVIEAIMANYPEMHAATQLTVSN